MKRILLIALLLPFASCNKILDEVRQRKVETISYSDYRYDIDSNNRRGFLDTNNDPMTGHFIVMHNELKAEEFQLKDGFLNGFHKFYNTDGKLMWEKNYSHNARDGVQKTFYDTGRLKSEVIYKEGRRDSDFLGYDHLGNMVYKLTAEGRLDYEHFYENDNRIASKFQKVVDGSVYDIIVMYDAFAQPELIFGQAREGPVMEFYYFDFEFNRGDPIVEPAQRSVAANLLGILVWN